MVPGFGISYDYLEDYGWEMPFKLRCEVRTSEEVFTFTLLGDKDSLSEGSTLRNDSELQ